MYCAPRGYLNIGEPAVAAEQARKRYIRKRVIRRPDRNPLGPEIQTFREVR